MNPCLFCIHSAVFRSSVSVRDLPLPSHTLGIISAGIHVIHILLSDRVRRPLMRLCCSTDLLRTWGCSRCVLLSTVLFTVMHTCTHAHTYNRTYTLRRSSARDSGISHWLWIVLPVRSADCGANCRCARVCLSIYLFVNQSIDRSIYFAIGCCVSPSISVISWSVSLDFTSLTHECMHRHKVLAQYSNSSLLLSLKTQTKFCEETKSSP